MPLTVRDATREDIASVVGDDSPLRVSFKAVAGVIDGDVVGVGGVAFVKGRVIAFCELKPEMRAYKVRMHKEALRVIADAKSRHRIIYAQASEKEPTAVRWLTRLGFKLHEGTLYTLWQS